MAVDAEIVNGLSNGCSGGVTRFYKRFLGRDIGCRYCCDEHDLAYAEGGNEADRELADFRFWLCMVESGRALRAWLFWLAVRGFGRLYWDRKE